MNPVYLEEIRNALHRVTPSDLLELKSRMSLFLGIVENPQFKNRVESRITFTDCFQEQMMQAKFYMNLCYKCLPSFVAVSCIDSVLVNSQIMFVTLLQTKLGLHKDPHILKMDHKPSFQFLHLELTREEQRRKQLISSLGVIRSLQSLHRVYNDQVSQGVLIVIIGYLYPDFTAKEIRYLLEQTRERKEFYSINMMQHHLTLEWK
jgi:hypothetical protein